MGLFKKKTGGTKNRRGGERVIWKKQNDEVVEKRQRANHLSKCSTHEMRKIGRKKWWMTLREKENRNGVIRK